MEPIPKRMNGLLEGMTVDVPEPEIQAAQPCNSSNDLRRLIHMLNNHLTIVIGNGQLMVLGDKNPEIKENINRIIDEAKEMSRIVRDLRSLVISKEDMRS